MDKTSVSIYGSHRQEMEKTLVQLTERIEEFRKQIGITIGIDPIEHIRTRIKTENSMREKCRRRFLPETEESALFFIHDAIGLRIVCPFLDEVYKLKDCLCASPDIEIIEVKDYIRNVKPNGYRSLHMIVKKNGYYAEIQLRTIAMDTWAALEHHIRYKKSISGNQSLIFEELKRCADELASTDASMQTIRQMISEEGAT